jgi:predicted RNase H-like HicB family nuclease
MIFSVLEKEEDGMFIAHCLELDIVATGDTPREARKDMVALICAQVDYAFSNDNLAHLYHPAPKEVWKQFFACKEAEERKYKIRSSFGETVPKGHVPPWLIAKTCRIPKTCRI